MKALREQRKLDKHKKLRKTYVEGDVEEELDEIISITTTVNDEVEDTDSELSEADSYCRHCLRPQSELQLKYMRPKQRSKLRQQQQAKRERSKQRCNPHCSGSNQQQKQQRASSKKRSKSRAKRARNIKNLNNNNINCGNHRELQHELPLKRDINVANEQAIRFRCPQVGPQVGRDRQMPPLLHFHHPQHVQQQLTAYQVQYTQSYGQQQQHQQLHYRQHHHSCKHYADQPVSPIQTTLTMESELKQQNHHNHLHHHHSHHQHQHPHHNEHLSDNQKSNKNQHHPCQVPTKETLTATTIATTELSNCCSSHYHTQSTHQPTTSQYQSPKRVPHCYQPTTCDCCCSCSCCNLPPTSGNMALTTTASTTITTFTSTQHHQHQHHYLPQLPLTHIETTSLVGATLDATTSAAAAATQPPLSTTDEQTNLQAAAGTAAEDDPSNLVAATTPDSPSLVKVSTWYTVAKQGVSC